MNEHNAPFENGKSVDERITKDRQDVEARRADINSRAGGDARRQAILKRLGALGRAS